MCCASKEMSIHLLLECPFSQAVWKAMLQELDPRVQWPNSIFKLLSNWHHLCADNLQKKDTFKGAWSILAKFIGWKLWLDRNKRIFQGETPNPLAVAENSLSLLTKHLNARGHTKIQPQVLDDDEKAWLLRLSLKHDIDDHNTSISF